MPLPILRKIADSASNAASSAGVSIPSLDVSAFGIGDLVSRGTNSGVLGSIVEKSLSTISDLKNSITSLRESNETVDMADTNVIADSVGDLKDESLSIQNLIYSETSDVSKGVKDIGFIMGSMATNAAKDRLEQARIRAFDEERAMESLKNQEELTDSMVEGKSEEKSGFSSFLGSFLGSAGGISIGSSIAGTLKKALGFFSLGGITSLIRLIPGIGQVAIAGYLLYEYWDDIKATFNSMFDAFTETWSKYVEPNLSKLADSLGKLQDSLMNAFNSIANGLSDMYDAVAPLFDGIFGTDLEKSSLGEAIGNGVGTIVNGFVIFLDTVVEIITWTVDLIAQLPEAIKAVGSWLSEDVMAPLGALYDYITEFRFLDDIADVGTDLGNKISDWFDDFLEMARSFLINSFADKGALGRSIARQFMTEQEEKEFDIKQNIKELQEQKQETEDNIKGIKAGDGIYVFGSREDDIQEEMARLKELEAAIEKENMNLKKETLGLSVVPIDSMKIEDIEQKLNKEAVRQEKLKSGNAVVTSINKPTNNIVQNNGAAIIAPTKTRNSIELY